MLTACNLTSDRLALVTDLNLYPGCCCWWIWVFGLAGNWSYLKRTQWKMISTMKSLYMQPLPLPTTQPPITSTTTAYTHKKSTLNPFLLSLFVCCLFLSLSLSLSQCIAEWRMHVRIWHCEQSMFCVEILTYNISLTHSCVYIYIWCKWCL